MKITHAEKLDIISRLIIVPENNLKNFWAKEIKFFNSLYKSFPDFYFWDSVSFSKKLESLLMLDSDYGRSILKKKFLEFNYKIKQPLKIKLGERTGQDFTYKKPKTIKDFLK